VGRVDEGEEEEEGQEERRREEEEVEEGMRTVLGRGRGVRRVISSSSDGESNSRSSIRNWLTDSACSITTTSCGL